MNFFQIGNDSFETESKLLACEVTLYQVTLGKLDATSSLFHDDHHEDLECIDSRCLSLLF